MFENMFSLNAQRAQVSGSTTTNSEGLVTKEEGDSDETPIYLQGDSVDEFRDLLWSLYALPHEIGMMMSPLADVVKLTNVARMAHKYHFANVEAWALSALTCLQTEHSTTIETHSLIHITEVAVLCEDAKLLQLVRKKWKDLIERHNDLSLAISVFERLGICDLNGLAYNAMMLQGRETWMSDPLLTREQRIRLLSGYHTISQICGNLPSNPPTFAHHHSCQRSNRCQKSWEILWRSATTLEFPTAEAIDKNDLINRVIWFKDLVLVTNSLLRANRKMDGDCVPLALEAMTIMSREFEARLIDFFQDESC